MSDSSDQQQTNTTISPLKSALAALFGVQKQSTQKKDFESGDATQFIGIGIMLTISLVVAMIVFVNWILTD